MNPERVTARFVHTYYTLLVGKQVTEKGPKLDRLYNENATLSIAQTTLGAQRREIAAQMEDLREKLQFQHIILYSIDYQPVSSNLLISVVGELKCANGDIPFSQSDTTFLIGTDLLRLHPVDLVIFTKTEEEGTKEREVPSVEMKFQLSPIVVATGPPEQPLKEEGSTPKQPARDEKQAQREAPSGKVEDITPDVTTTTTEPTATWKNKFTTSLRGPTTPATPSTPTTIQRLVQTQSQNKPEKEKATTASLVGFNPQQSFPPVKTFFVQYGATSVRLKGTYAFVEFGTSDQAQKVLNLKPLLFEGKELRVDVAKDDGRKAQPTVDRGNNRRK